MVDQQCMSAKVSVHVKQVPQERAMSSCREKKRANDFRTSSESYRRKYEAALKEQRALVKKLGEAERNLGGSTAARQAARKAAAEEEFWSEEAGRRFAVQQEELVALREQNAMMQEHLAAGTYGWMIMQHNAVLLKAAVPISWGDAVDR
jgi:hypothetical protein